MRQPGRGQRLVFRARLSLPDETHKSRLQNSQMGCLRQDLLQEMGTSVCTLAGRGSVKKIGCLQNCWKSCRSGFEVGLLPE